MRRLKALLLGDVKNVLRDSNLVVFTVLPLFLAVLIRFGEPPLRKVALPYFNLADYHGMIMALLTAMIPAMYGWVVGFMLLDDRDQHTLAAIAVTPLTKKGYMAYKIASLALVSFALNLILIPLTGLSGLNYPRFIPVALMASLEAPLFALLLTALAGNKVEGLAVAKFLGLVDVFPALPFLIASPLVYAAGIFPFFWIGASLRFMNGPLFPFLLSLAAGFIIHGIFLVLLLRLYDRRAE